MKQVFVTFYNGTIKVFKNFTLLPDRYLQIGDNEPCPIEDYGDCMICDDGLTEDEMWNLYLENT